ncbi:hypothetical protein ACFSCW_13250 [Sphingomonas tabacisoli]|uniref:Uracil DNA glycosylase superfamily protein n=1 Tax=Sphingomonas tabacisoli TaxID=2249466 RepID=A0ABW4I5U1_9SPHN
MKLVASSQQNSAERIEARAAQMYARINELWCEHREDIFGGACGFSILSGPPAHRPPLLVIGANPGFGANDHGPDVEICWPTTSYIGSATWPLAGKLRYIFERAGKGGLLDHALQTNFLFFKSSSLKKESRYRWFNLPGHLRSKLEGICAAELFELISMIEPRLILVLGLDPFDTYATGVDTVLRDRNGKRRLLVKGYIAGLPAVATLHPTGAQVANEDWMRVSDWLRQNV